MFAVGRSREARSGPCSVPGASASDELDKILPIAPWVLHDLRRTARCLLARIGVNRDIAERMLGHKEGGVLAIYDRHDYAAEMADAAARLAGELERILNVGAGAGAAAAEAA